MEAAEQKFFVQWFRQAYPAHRKALRVSMAGLPRHGKKGAIQWNMMKGQGVEKDEADIVIALPRGGYGSLVIEHKGEGMARQLTGGQLAYLEYHESIGNRAVSTRGLVDLMNVVSHYMGLTDDAH